MRAGLSKLRCSTPDMLQNWHKGQTRHISHVNKCHFGIRTLRGRSQVEVGIFGEKKNESYLLVMG